MLFLLSSCRSSRKAQKGDDTPVQPVVEQRVDTILSNETNLVAKVKATVVMGAQSVTTDGTLRMRRDEVIQLSLIDPYLGIMEVGRMELTPNRILIVDRVNKQYIETTYERFQGLNSRLAEFDFKAIQLLFWNEALRSEQLHYVFKAKQNIDLTLRLSGIRHTDDWETHTSVSRKYTPVDVNKLFSSLLQQ